MFKFLILILVFLSPYVFGASEATALSAAGYAVPSAPKLMGIEVETSTIKLRSPGSGKLGFIVGSPPVWMIEEDTQDDTFKAHEELVEFNRNMEFKTIGGHGRDSIIAMSVDIERCARLMYENSLAASFPINPDVLGSFLARDINVVPKESDQGDFVIKSKNENPVIRLQITYQIPLEEIHRIFKRLRELGHKNVKEFLDALDPSIPLRHREPSSFERMEAAGASSTLINNLKEKDKIQKLLKERLAPVFASLEENRLKGFMCLFVYYWYEIFNNKHEAYPEPGVKPWLAIMSRVPLSQLYDSLLPAEQASFRTIMEGMIIEMGGEYKVRDYISYDKKLVLTKINVKDWYYSLVDSSKRQKVKITKRLEALSRPYKKVDLLSPPPGLDDTYSMGSLDLKDSSGFPLLEVRGYSSIQLAGKDLTIMDLNGFVTTESSWFFGS